MTNHAFRLALLCLLATGALPALAQTEPQLITVPLSRPGEPLSLEMSIISAHIEVIGEAREDAQFEVSVMEGTRKIITPSGTRSLTTGAYSIEVEEADNHIRVDTDWRANQVRIVARIPRRADLELSTVNDGEITVTGIEGKLQLQNVNGPITATGITGSVIAESVNETVEVRFDAVDPNAAMSFTSVNGDLILGLPENTGAELHIDSSEGEITSDYEVEVRPSKPVVSRENSGKGVEVRVESVIIAEINGGGAVIRLKTLNGDIQIRRSGS